MNVGLRKIAINSSSSPMDEALLKRFYLTLRNIRLNWIVSIRDRKVALNQVAIRFEERPPEW